MPKSGRTLSPYSQTHASKSSSAAVRAKSPWSASTNGGRLSRFYGKMAIKRTSRGRTSSGTRHQLRKPGSSSCRTVCHQVRSWTFFSASCPLIVWRPKSTPRPDHWLLDHRARASYRRQGRRLSRSDRLKLDTQSFNLPCLSRLSRGYLSRTHLRSSHTAQQIPSIRHSLQQQAILHLRLTLTLITSIRQIPTRPIHRLATPTRHIGTRHLPSRSIIIFLPMGDMRRYKASTTRRTDMHTGILNTLTTLQRSRVRHFLLWAIISHMHHYLVLTLPLVQRRRRRMVLDEQMISLSVCIPPRSLLLSDLVNISSLLIVILQLYYLDRNMMAVSVDCWVVRGRRGAPSQAGIQIRQGIKRPQNANASPFLHHQHLLPPSKYKFSLQFLYSLGTTAIKDSRCYSVRRAPPSFARSLSTDASTRRVLSSSGHAALLLAVEAKD